MIGFNRVRSLTAGCKIECELREETWETNRGTFTSTMPVWRCACGLLMDLTKPNDYRTVATIPGTKVSCPECCRDYFMEHVPPDAQAELHVEATSPVAADTEEAKRSLAPVAMAIVLLLLPVLYMGSYCALVAPKGVVVSIDHFEEGGLMVSEPIEIAHFRTTQAQAAWFFWPLEQIDRKLRPDAWDPVPAIPF